MINEPTPTQSANPKTLQWPAVVLIVCATSLLTVLLMALVIKYYFFPSPFQPVALNSQEEQVLTGKLERLSPGLGAGMLQQQNSRLKPEPYSETDAKREIEFTEREVNALMAKNTSLADKLAIDFSDDLISAKLLLPMDPDFPVLGGQTVRINLGMELTYQHQQPVAILKGVSVMGVPLPNAWLGNLKHVDLVKEFGGQNGFWNTFAAGIAELEVKQGHLRVKLKE